MIEVIDLALAGGALALVIALLADMIGEAKARTQKSRRARR